MGGAPALGGFAASASGKASGEGVEPNAEAVKAYLDGSPRETIPLTRAFGSEAPSIDTPLAWRPVPRHCGSCHG